MIDRNSPEYGDFVRRHHIPGTPHVPACARDMPPGEIEARLDEARASAPALGDHAAYTIALCRGRTHKAYFIDDPEAKGRAFFCTTWGEPLTLGDLQFEGCTPTVLLLYSAACLQARHHVHTLLVVDTPILLSALSDGRRWSVVGTAAGRAMRYIENQQEDDVSCYMVRGLRSEYYDCSSDSAATRLTYDGGTLAPLPRRVRIAEARRLGYELGVTIHRGTRDMRYPWSSVYELSLHRGLERYMGEPAITCREEDLPALVEIAQREPGLVWSADGLTAHVEDAADTLLGNLRDVFVTEQTFGPTRADLLLQEDARLTRLDEREGSHDPPPPPADPF